MDRITSMLVGLLLLQLSVAWGSVLLPLDNVYLQGVQAGRDEIPLKEFVVEDSIHIISKAENESELGLAPKQSLSSQITVNGASPDLLLSLVGSENNLPNVEYAVMPTPAQLNQRQHQAITKELPSSWPPDWILLSSTPSADYTELPVSEADITTQPPTTTTVNLTQPQPTSTTPLLKIKVSEPRFRPIPRIPTGQVKKMFPQPNQMFKPIIKDPVPPPKLKEDSAQVEPQPTTRLVNGQVIHELITIAPLNAGSYGDYQLDLIKKEPPPQTLFGILTGIPHYAALVAPNGGNGETTNNSHAQLQPETFSQLPDESTAELDIKLSSGGLSPLQQRAPSGDVIPAEAEPETENVSLPSPEVESGNQQLPNKANTGEPSIQSQEEQDSPLVSSIGGTSSIHHPETWSSFQPPVVQQDADLILRTEIQTSAGPEKREQETPILNIRETQPSVQSKEISPTIDSSQILPQPNVQMHGEQQVPRISDSNETIFLLSPDRWPIFQSLAGQYPSSSR